CTLTLPVSGGSLKTIGRIGLREIDGGLDGGKDILGSVLSFPSESDDVFVVPPSLRDVPRDF
ncbi:MAG: hypothetical protein WCD69_29110, partial [Xanthobacteraceae bacterium]